MIDPDPPIITPEIAAYRRRWYGPPSWLPRLASNLANAGALCRAFRIGYDAGWNDTGEGFNGEYTGRDFTAEKYERLATYGNDGDWRPGCGRPSP